MIYEELVAVCCSKAFPHSAALFEIAKQQFPSYSCILQYSAGKKVKHAYKANREARTHLGCSMSQRSISNVSMRFLSLRESPCAVAIIL
jgi:hypothetical protein